MLVARSAVVHREGMMEAIRSYRRRVLAIQRWWRRYQFVPVARRAYCQRVFEVRIHARSHTHLCERMQVVHELRQTRSLHKWKRLRQTPQPPRLEILPKTQRKLLAAKQAEVKLLFSQMLWRRRVQLPDVRTVFANQNAFGAAVYAEIISQYKVPTRWVHLCVSVASRTPQQRQQQPFPMCHLVHRVSRQTVSQWVDEGLEASAERTAQANKQIANQKKTSMAVSGAHGRQGGVSMRTNKSGSPRRRITVSSSGSREETVSGSNHNKLHHLIHLQL